jgi:hypothetical protein
MERAQSGPTRHSHGAGFDESEPHTSGYTPKMRMYGGERNTPLPFAPHCRKRRIEQSIIPSSGASWRASDEIWSIACRFPHSFSSEPPPDPTRWKFPKLYCTARIPTLQFLIQINQFKGPSRIQDSRSRILLRGSNMPFQRWIKSEGNLQAQPLSQHQSINQFPIPITNRHHESTSQLNPYIPIEPCSVPVPWKHTVNPSLMLN